MRFDDRLATILGRDPARTSARASQWRQLLDILAQRDDAPLAGEAIGRMAAMRPLVPVDTRRDAAAAIAGRPLAPGVVALLADDVPAVAGVILSRVALDEAAWRGLLPRLSPTARGFLRHRRDLDSGVTMALASFGATDLALGGTVAAPEEDRPAPPAGAPVSDFAMSPVAEPFEPEGGEGQIRAIISRIARFQSVREEPAPPPPLGDFHFETDADGIVVRVDGAPRGAILGETIASPADGRYGVDAQAPGAFRARAPFRDARLTVAGAGPAAGEWRIAGVPVFATRGDFLGYRCTARRPIPTERTPAAGGVDPDTLRQLVHELRTPINAIGGFAEMIRRQMRGPVAEAYRARADAIVAEAARLMAAVDDLDVSARLDTDRLGLQRTAVDLAGLVDAIIVEHREGLGADAIPPARIGDAAAMGDLAAIRRMVARLIAATQAVATPGEPIAVTIAAVPGDLVELSLPRPARLAAVSEQALFDPGFDEAGAWPDAPLLGLGFSLHLVRRLAVAVGGTLGVEAHRFVLRLPAAAALDDARIG